MIVKGGSLPPPKELQAPVVFDDWKDVESFADRHFELYAQTHLGRYSFRMADKRREWAQHLKNELRVSELQELDFSQLLEKETGEFLIPFSVLGPLHPSGAPPLEPFFPIDKRQNGRDPVWSDAFGLPWVVYPDGRSDLVLERPIGGPRVKDRERARALQTRQTLAGQMARGTRKRGEEAERMIEEFQIPEPKFVPKSPQQHYIRTAGYRRVARNMDCVEALIAPEQFPPRDKLVASPSYLMEGFDYKDTLSVLYYDQDSRASSAARFRNSVRARRHAPAGPFPDTLDQHCPVDEVAADGEPCEPLTVPNDPEDDEPGLIAQIINLVTSYFEPTRICEEPPEQEQFDVEEEEEAGGAGTAGKLMPVDQEQPFPFSSYPGLIPAKHMLKYTWKSEVENTFGGGEGLAGGALVGGSRRPFANGMGIKGRCPRL